MVQDTTDLAEHRLRRRLDLAGGVNRYGPPDAALDVLRSLTAADLAATARPTAAARLRSAYAGVLGVDAGELVAGHGPATFLRALRGHVAVPLPAADGLLALFPGCGFVRYPGEQLPSLEQVDAALEAADVVVISNPHMPTGVVLDPDALAGTARRHPASTLVVDESAVDFLADPRAGSLVGSGADNVVVIRSAADFYSLAATRTAVAWTRDPLLRTLLSGTAQTPSALDVAVVEAALAAGDWAAEIRRRLAADGDWLGGVVPVLGGRPVHSDLPYRFILSDTAADVAATMAAAGITVRAFGPGHGVHPGAIGLSAPLEAERSLLAVALGAAHAGPVLSEAG